MANKHMKEFSNVLVYREIQVKATVEYLYTPTRTAKTKWQVIQVWQRGWSSLSGAAERQVN